MTDQPIEPGDHVPRRVFLREGAAALGTLWLAHRTTSHAGSISRREGLEEFLEPIRSELGLPALAGAIVASEGPLAVGAVGLRKFGDATSVTADDPFHLGSCTKAMTATLLALHVQEGRLAWDTTLARALPQCAAAMRPAYRDVTIRSLLAHQSGLSGESWPIGATLAQMHALPGSPRAQRESYVASILAEEPVNEPGTQFLYSNRNYAVAGAIAETLGDEEWEAQMRQRIFGPLGMASAGFGSMGTPEKVDQPWQHRKVGSLLVPIEPGPRSDNPDVIGPAGKVHSNLSDWGRFVALHLAGEQGRDGILPSAAIQEMHRFARGESYAFGWGTVDRPWGGGAVYTHAGSNTMNYAVVWMAPRKDFAVLAATNLGSDPAPEGCDRVSAGLIGRHQGRG